MQIWAARKFPALVSWPYYYPLYRERESEEERESVWAGPILHWLNFQWGIYLYFFVHPLLSFSVFFLMFGEQLFAYLRGPSTCYPQFVLSGSQRPLPKCSLGLSCPGCCPAGHFYSSRAQWRRRLLRRVWKKRTKRHKVCRAFAFGIQQDKHKMKCEAKAATNFQLTKFEEF